MSFRSCQILALSALLSLAGSVHAQLRLPSIGSSLSPIARAPVLQRLEPVVETVLAPVDLATARSQAVEQRLRAHRRELARDRRGELIVRAEVLAQPSSPAARAALMAAGFTVLREDTLEGLDDPLVVMKAPTGLDLDEAVVRARAIDPDGAYDFHHVYLGGGSVGSASAPSLGPGGVTPAAVHAAPLHVGLIDSGVDARHPALANAIVQRHGCEDGAHPAAHGTAVASLMIGQSGAFRSALPRATLYAGDAFCDSATGGSVEAIARELAWMMRMQVAVVNISLVGPANQILKRVIAHAVDQGVLIVAAVGNDGPAAPPLYPASWPGVVGVGAVDGRLRLLPEGARGPQVMFVAPGADMAAAANGEDGFAPVRGTSFAAPFVAGLLAASYQVASPDGARAAIARLASVAQDLAAAPRDGIGRGLVAQTLRTALDTVALVR